MLTNASVVYKREKLTIENFLEKLNLSKYFDNFISNGFDDTNFLVSLYKSYN